MNAYSTNLRSVAANERKLRGAVELARIIDLAAHHIDNQDAEIVRLRAVLKQTSDELGWGMWDRAIQTVGNGLLNDEHGNSSLTRFISCRAADGL